MSHWIISFILVLGTLSPAANAQVIAPSAEEAAFQYSTQFLLEDGWGTAEEQALFHAQYLFGVLHSPSMVAAYDLDPDLLEGIGAPRLPLTVKVGRTEVQEDGRTLVNYQGFGRLLLHKEVARQTKGTEGILLHLPYDMRQIYLKKCTDPHYFGIDDYWYFWDPYRSGCEKLQTSAVTREVILKFTWITTTPAETTPDLDRWRGDNGNGDTLSVYVMNGFNESSLTGTDEGRVNFEEVKAAFLERGYEIEFLNRHPQYTRNRYTKRLQRGGKILNVEVIHQLANTDITADAITFPRAFKEAVLNGDLVVYLGHSGLGANLDIANLNYKLSTIGEGPITFYPDKYQIFFFDSCASYSYYLPEFRALKPKSKIDILSYGLSSLFESSGGVFRALIDDLLNLNQPKSWKDILRDMEKPLDGSTFLLNVGGV